MIREELKKLPTDPRALRQFGLVVGAAGGLVALWVWVRYSPFYAAWLILAVLLLGLGLVHPRSLKWPYLVWMGLALLVGHVVSTVLLVLLFFLIVTPLGFVARCLSKDFLDRKLDRQAASYWRPRDRMKPRPKARYEQQF